MVARHCVLAGYNPIHMVSSIEKASTHWCDDKLQKLFKKTFFYSFSFYRQSGLLLSGFIHDWKEGFHCMTMNKMAAKDEAVPWVYDRTW